MNVSLTDSLEVNALVKEFRNPGSILPLIPPYYVVVCNEGKKLLLNFERWSYALGYGGMAVTPPPPIKKFKALHHSSKSEILIIHEVIQFAN